MRRSRKLAGLVAIALIAGVIGAWSIHSTSPHPGAKPRSAGPQLAAPLAIATRTRGELAVADPEGRLRIEGQVIDVNDQPVGGARVSIDTLPPRSVTTEPDGSFAVDGLLGRRYTVVALGGDGVAGPVTTWLDARTPALILRLRAAAGVGVTVIDAISGAPIQGATVEVRAPIVVSATTTAQGTAVVSPVVPGHWPLMVTAPRYAIAFDSVSASATARYEVAIALKRGMHARGKVIDQAGKPVRDAVVWAESVGDWMTEIVPTRDGVRSDGDGSFDLSHVGRATYVFHAVAPDHASGATGMLAIEGDTEGITVRVSAGARVAGRVTHKDGTAASGAAVRASWGRGSRLAHVGSDGTFTLDALPSAKLWLTASDGAASSKPRELDLASASPHQRLEIVLDHDAIIAGSVVDHAGAPVEGAPVTAVRSDAFDAEANAATRVQELSDSSGRFTLGGLVAGQYRLTAARDPRQAGNGKPTIVAAGTTNVTLTLASYGQIKGRVAFRTGGVPSAYTVRVGRGGLATQFAAAEFEIEAPPGVQALWIEGPGFTATSVDGVTVTEGAATDAGTIELDRGRTLRGRVTSMGGMALVNGEVIAGALLSGTGQRVDTGESGPEFRSDVKHAEVGPDGAFQLTGVTTTAVSVVATLGSGARSAPLPVPAGHDDIDGLVLTIAREARLSGSVTRNGQPTAALVNAQSQASPLTMFTVEAASGAYHFDQLAPGRYTVAAIAGAPLAGSPFYPRAIELAPGMPATLDLLVDPGTAALTVEAPGSGSGLVFVTTRPGTATSALALLGELGRQDGGQWAMTMIQEDRARFQDLTTGPGRVCVVRIPMKAQTTPSALIEQIARAGASLAATCVTTQLGAATTVTIGGPSRGAL